MRRTSHLGLTLALAACLAAMAVAPTAAMEQRIDCTEVGVFDPEFGDWFLEPQTFHGDVVVPNIGPDTGALCVFANPVIKGDLIVEASSPEQGDLGPVALIFAGAAGGEITGDVIVRRGADLINFGATVGGNVRCHECDRVELAGGEDFDGTPFTTRVEGNVIVDRARFGAAVREAVVHGNVSIRRSTARLEEASGAFDTVEVTSSTVHGNVRLARNTGNADSIRVADTTVAGNLMCRRNDPRPALGAGNTVEGRTFGQCR